MNKKEVLDAISQEFRKSLQDIGVTNGDVIKAMFPNALKSNYIEKNGIAIIYLQDKNESEMAVPEDWLNAPYEAESEDK